MIHNDDGPPSGPWEAQRAGQSNSHQGGDDGADSSRWDPVAAGWRRCPDGTGEAVPGGPLRHDGSCPLGVRVARVLLVDADELQRRQGHPFRRRLTVVERAELGVVLGRAIPREHRSRWHVHVSALPDGARRRTFTRDGKPVAAVTDPRIEAA